MSKVLKKLALLLLLTASGAYGQLTPGQLSGFAGIEYSIDSGASWNPYTGVGSGTPISSGQLTGMYGAYCSADSGATWLPCSFSGGPGGGTVTSVATSGPITGGTITAAGTIGCPTCGVTGSPLSQFAATTSAQLAGVISNETGTGVLVFNTNPALITPDLGTPSALVLTNATGLPVGAITGLGTGVGTWLATPSSANLAAAITDETGSGVAVFNNGPTLTAPIISTISNTGTITLPTATDTLVARATTDTLSNKRITRRVSALSANSATPAVNTDNFDVVHITAQTATITSFTMTGTPVDGDTLRISITGTASVPFTLGSSFEASTLALSTTTSGTARLDMGFIWNTETSKWRQVAAQ